MTQHKKTPATPEEEAAVEYVRHTQEAAADIPGLPEVDPAWRPVRAAVVGAGTMGGGIAMALANAEVPVTLIDRGADNLARGIERIKANYASSVRRGRLEQSVADRRMGLITPVADLAAVADADVVVEAVFEEMHVKQEVFRALDRHVKADVLLGTNTSALDIDAIASATSGPDRVVGTHFFSPAHVMRLLEVVPGAATGPATLAEAMALGRLLGKVAVRAGNSHGFIGNAMLFDYRREAFFVVEEGAFPSDVDRVLTDFGFAMGLFTMTDMSGLDLGVDSKRKAIATRPKDRRYTDLGLLLVDLGRLGQKTGAGWYRYEPGDRTAHRDPEMDREIVAYSARIGIERRKVSDEEILKRCLYALVNRGAWLVEQGVAAKPGDVDAVYTTGYGFPKTKGGPLYWADSIGLSTVLADIERLHEEHGVWWEPAPLLVRLARDGATFTGPSAGAKQGETE
ncbi:3-hydroxyacyl-CoA dehydrogenase [Amycolatopsis taiwanensis]|uniref:3-hydroxyacyl-CoA dehydrogenase n=1 Tax=Amycolatopsis taiwanensis TaxID=342230 RepID=A0A9W6VK93_9PSEU|nr:3-hydroxyacyl-CoA dehydrogenase [Amycolatopsis taiwanensis]GLY70222.1 3-hydroxyacyl-CoA dehydrogenase [Amycolatopsis taiwanensis]